MLHIDDTVEVVSSKRVGAIDLISTDPQYWRVQFPDGNQPPSELFPSESALRLVNCPHAGDGKPSFYPASPIM